MCQQVGVWREHVPEVAECHLRTVNSHGGERERDRDLSSSSYKASVLSDWDPTFGSHLTLITS